MKGYNINFCNDAIIKKDLTDILQAYMPCFCENGEQITVECKKKEDSGFKAYYFSDTKIVIEYNTKRDYLTGLAQFLSAPRGKKNVVENAFTIKDLGIMLDCARNAVANLDSIKKMIVNVALAGYTFFELYTEDCFEVDNQPKFGFMRGRYTKEQLKELDKFCLSLGIELIPCIQTLAHYNQLFRHAEYIQINDVNDILLVEDEKTHALLNDIFSTVRQCFSSNKINIGFDEAHMVGLGEYLNRNGFKNRYELLQKHLDFIMQLCEKYNFKPSVWSDMFFRLAFNGSYYPEEKHFTKEQIDCVDKNVELIYWDYYHKDADVYRYMLDRHHELSNNIAFAAGAWKWQGFAPYNRYSHLTMTPAITAIKEKGINSFLLTMWGDNGAECSMHSLYNTLLTAAFAFCKNRVTAVEQDGLSCLLTGYTMAELMALDLPNMISPECQDHNFNPSKYLLYDDILIGAYSQFVKKEYTAKFKENAATLRTLSLKESPYAYIFDTLYKLCSVLEIKCGLWQKIYAAYQNKDRSALEKLSQVDIKTVIERVETFYSAFNYQWHQENKALGFEIQDLRLGGLIQRLKAVQKRLLAYVNGSIDCIEELEEKRVEIVSDQEKNGNLFVCNYALSNMSFNTF